MDMDAAKSGDMPRAKSWRGFLIEIWTIIVGILIALGVNQVVDDLRERRITQEARTAVRAEIASNLGGMLLRRGTQACINRRLEQMGQILEAARDGRAYAPPGWIGRPITWPTQARRWSATSQAGRASLLPSDEQAEYAGAYYSSETFGNLEDQEQISWATLRGMQGVRAMPPAVAIGFGQALEQARYENWRIKLTTERLEDEAVRLKIAAAPVVLVKQSRLASVCVPIGTGRQAALAMIGNPFGEP